jgi:protein-disulfide isomerase
MIRSLTAAAIVFLTAIPALAEDAAAPAAAPAPAATESPAPAATSSSPPATQSSASKSSGAFVPNPSAKPDQPPAKPFIYRPKVSDVVDGKEDAPVTIVEYASLSCPHCAHFFKDVLPELTAKYLNTGKAKLVFRSYPLNDPALKGAELVQCAPPEKRPAFIRVLFTQQMKWAYDANYREALGNFAVFGGIDRLKFESCMNDKAIEKIVLDVAKEAQDDYRVNSTPTFFVNGKVERGMHDVAALGKMVDDEIAAQKK